MFICICIYIYIYLYLFIHCYFLLELYLCYALYAPTVNDTITTHASEVAGTPSPWTPLSRTSRRRLCYAILYYTILYYTMICYAILCYTILYYTMPSRTSRPGSSLTCLKVLRVFPRALYLPTLDPMRPSSFFHWYPRIRA